MIEILVLALVIVLIVLGVRRRRGTRGPGTLGSTEDAHGVRRFFQYLLLYGLLVIVGVGLTGLLGTLLEQGTTLVEEDRSSLALSLSYTVVGVPLYVGLAWWSRRRFADDPTEASSLGWAFYVTFAALTSLVAAMIALYAVLAGLTGVRPDEPAAWGQLVVWGGLWGAHWWVDRRVTPPARSRLHHLAGSVIGLGTSVAGLSTLIAGLLALVLGLQDEGLLAGGDDTLLRGVCLTVVGTPVWLTYWLLTMIRSERDTPWLVYVLLAGIGGGLVLAITSASLLVFDVLVWLLGNPSPTEPASFFSGTPTQAGIVVVGLLSWWYHRAVLSQERATTETEDRGPSREVWRVYTYLLAGIGLVAAGVGLTLLIVALIEAVTGAAAIVIGSSAVNTLLGAITLFLVGGPVWWWYWRRATRAAHDDPAEELTSPTRRVYLYLLFGIGGVAAVVALIVGVFIFVQDALQGDVSADTLHTMRVPIGILVTTGTIAGYHGAVFQSDRRHAPMLRRGPAYVLLIGPAPDPTLAQALAHRTGGHVQAWRRTDDGEQHWTIDEVVAALGQTGEDEVVVLEEDGGGLRAIPIRRR